MANEVKWTEEQKQAIYEKGSNLLVAAAAGSGKTSVLQEVIKLLNNDGYTNIVTSREPGGIKIPDGHVGDGIIA